MEIKTFGEVKTIDKTSFLRFVPYAGVTLIFLGFVRLMTYYTAFGINIINFLEFSEIVTTFLDMTVVITIAIIGMTIQGIWHNSPGERQKMFTENFKKYERIRKKKGCIFWRKRWSIRGKCIWHCMPMIVLLLILLSYLGYLHNHLNRNQIFRMFGHLIVLSLLFSTAIFKLERRHLKRNSSIESRQQMQVLVYGILLFLIVLISSFSDVSGVRRDKSTYEVSFVMEDETTNKETLIVSDSSDYYIGNTKNYLFFYHQCGDSTEVIPMKQVKSLTFPDRSDCVYRILEFLF